VTRRRHLPTVAWSGPSLAADDGGAKGEPGERLSLPSSCSGAAARIRMIPRSSSSLYLSYEMQRRYILHSYRAIGTSWPLDSCEAAMATVTFNAMPETEHVWSRFKAVLAALSEMLDAFGSNQMRRATVETRNVRPRHRPSHMIAIGKYPMTAVQLMSPDPSRHTRNSSTAAVEQEHAHAGRQPADEPTRVTAQFQPLDHNIISESIPAFFIGRNMEGFWVARDVNGQIGGIFLLETSALSFAKRNSRSAACATIYPYGTIELDLENEGNPLVAQLGSLARLSPRVRQRMAVFVGRMTESLKRKLQDS
jgi:hypothetical protein